MLNPEIYKENNSIQRYHTEATMKKYSKYFKWAEENAKILDIGCGPGDVTRDIILPHLPEKFSKVIGVDLSEDMVQTATKNNRHPKFEFKQLDIRSECLPEELVGHFDHIFSFFCYHWITDQRRLYKNLNNLLKPGGNTIFTLVVFSGKILSVQTMAKSPKWKVYLDGVEWPVTPYLYDPNPKGKIKELLEETGFKIDRIEEETIRNSFGSRKEMLDFITSISPFYHSVPDNMKEEYLNDLLIFFKFYSVECGENEIMHKIVIVSATKS